MLFFSFTRIGLSWIISIALIGLFYFIARGDSLGETISYNTRLPSTVAVFSALSMQQTAIRGSFKLFLTGTVLFLATLPVFAFLTGAPRFMFKLTGNKPLDYAILYGTFYLALSLTLFIATWLTLKKQTIKPD
ncbi:hypothetical protein [Mesorhizobium sp. KR2-14]|uniref:hypothetical protein n=1 Tax=Mesorhizobium sp. KR2-14 TaxID=3156610 RepID=UPI0032B5A519